MSEETTPATTATATPAEPADQAEPATTTAAAPTAPAEPAASAEPATPAEPAAAEAPAEPKPYLGEQPAAKPAEAQPAPATPQPPSDDDYVKALVKDEAQLGTEKDIQLDANLFKAVLPTMKKYGVSPEAANALANALAKAQIDDAREHMRARVEYFERMKQESMRTYTPNDFEQISAGIDRWFKPGGVMNAVIRNSELGADPEFLALMHHLGKAVKQDGAAGAAAGGGTSGMDPNSTEGLSKIW